MRRPLRDAPPESSRYELLVKIASGGMATVHVGRLRGAQGFSRLVAVKRAHPHLAEDRTFRRMLIAEARLASRIHHPNVVSVLDVEEGDGELCLVMDYVDGAALSDLLGAAMTAGAPLPPAVAVRIALDVAAGLHAAHWTTNDDGRPLGVVHRDVSPHNVLVGLEGVARIADFGIAKCVGGGTLTGTATGVLKGKVAYMAPEYVEHGTMDARGDVFALGVVVWEALANRRLFRGQNELETMRRVTSWDPPPLSRVAPWLGAALDAVVATALARSPDARFQSARSFGDALEAAARAAGLHASAADVGDVVRAQAGARIARRRAELRASMDGEATLVDERPAPDGPSVAAAPGVETHEAPLPAMVTREAPMPAMATREAPMSAMATREAPLQAMATREANAPASAASAGPIDAPRAPALAAITVPIDPRAQAALLATASPRRPDLALGPDTTTRAYAPAALARPAPPAWPPSTPAASATTPATPAGFAPRAPVASSSGVATAATAPVARPAPSRPAWPWALVAAALVALGLAAARVAIAPATPPASSAEAAATIATTGAAGPAQGGAASAPVAPGEPGAPTPAPSATPLVLAPPSASPAPPSSAAPPPLAARPTKAPAAPDRSASRAAPTSAPTVAPEKAPPNPYAR